MDHLEDFKDTESINSRPGRVQALFHLVLGIIVFFGAAAYFWWFAHQLICSYYITLEKYGIT